MGADILGAIARIDGAGALGGEAPRPFTERQALNAYVGSTIANREQD